MNSIKFIKYVLSLFVLSLIIFNFSFNFQAYSQTPPGQNLSDPSTNNPVIVISSTNSNQSIQSSISSLSSVSKTTNSSISTVSVDGTVRTGGEYIFLVSILIVLGISFIGYLVFNYLNNSNQLKTKEKKIK